MRFLNLALLFILSVNFTFADISVPEKSKDKAYRTRLVLRTSPDVTEPTLTIPRSAIKDLRAQLDEIENETDATASTTTPNFVKTSTVLSGVFLSLAFVFGGVLFLRKKPSKTTVGLILLAIFSASATLIYANIAPPIIERLDANIFSEKMKQSYRGATGNVRVKLAKNSTQIELALPTNTEKANREE